MTTMTTAEIEISVLIDKLTRAAMALKLVRALVVESSGVPRYSVIPGAALNAVIEEVVDPMLRELDQ